MQKSEVAHTARENVEMLQIRDSALYQTEHVAFQQSPPKCREVQDMESHTGTHL